MRTSLIHAIGLLSVVSVIAHAAEAPKDEAPSIPIFKAQEIDRTLKIGYGVKLVDLNGDGKLDVLVADSERVIWFQNPGGDGGGDWKLHTVLQDKAAGIMTDNVCIDVYDIDGDGKLDIALGADWQPSNTKAGGSLQWLRQPTDIDQPWEVHPIFESEPTLHRIHFGVIDDSGKPQLIVGPLKGKASTAPTNFMDVGARLMAYPIPKDPAKGEWEGQLITSDLHVMHNFLPDPWGDAARGGRKGAAILTASYEGVNLLHRDDHGKWSAELEGEGDQSMPKGSRGSSEIKVGHLGGTQLLATIEPFHGNQVVVYTPPMIQTRPAGVPPPRMIRSVLDDSFVEGHGLWCADLDGDGNDEVIAGFRGGKGGVRIYKAGPPNVDPPHTRDVFGERPWQKFDLDLGGVAVEDLACADLNGDGRVDIVAVGRASHNVKIYWNQGAGTKRP